MLTPDELNALTQVFLSFDEDEIFYWITWSDGTDESIGLN